MFVGFVSDEYYAALADVQIEFWGESGVCVARSTASGAVRADLSPGWYEVCLSRAGFGSKRVRVELDEAKPVQFRLLSDRLVGYAWPKWCRAGDRVDFRVHSVEPYKVGLWRYGFHKEFVRNLGWYDNHGPRAAMQTLPDGHFVESGVHWDNGFGLHRQTFDAPGRGGLYFVHCVGKSGEFFGFPLVVAPAEAGSRIAVLASTNTWNAYNAFGGRSNYIMAARMIDAPIVNAKSDLPRYRLANYGEWKSASEFAPLSFDRPEPYNHIPAEVDCADPIEGRQACHLVEAEWRLLAWMERRGYDYDLYADYQLDQGVLDLDRYRVLVLGVHPEYWSEGMYRRVKEWVFERGGKLMYLGGNGVNCKVEYGQGGSSMTCQNAWPEGFESRFHRSVESEANLLGVVYSDSGAMTVAPYEVIDAEHWVFAGTGMKAGSRFGVKTLHERYGDGASGHETDKISASSPKRVHLLAKGMNPDAGGAEMVHFDTPGGGEVFSVGSITYASALFSDDVVAGITSNVIDRFLGEG